MQSFSKSVLGKVRRTNQDYCIEKNEKIGIFNNLFIVADGVGGNSKSAYASKHSCDFLVEQLSKTTDGQNKIEILSTAIKLANTDLYYRIMSNEEYNGMGTTLVVATISKEKLLVANIGDSRCYYIRNKIINQITHDHSVAEELVREKQIERNSEKFFEYKNQLTRAIGAQRNINPDFFEIELKSDDYIVMCSDGLTNMVKEDYIVNVVTKEELSLEDKVNLLIDKANENGGKDNITVIVIKIEDEDFKENNEEIDIDAIVKREQKEYMKEDNIVDNLVSPDEVLNKYKPKDFYETNKMPILLDENMSNLKVDPNKFINKDDIKIYEGLKGRSRKRKDIYIDNNNFERKEDE